MHIAFVEIQNFRKLQSVRIDFSKQTTLLVGANNSGKTSATLALRQFLVEPERFSTNDFTLSKWGAIEAIATGWEEQATTPGVAPPTLAAWESALPALDVWLEIDQSEIHYVRRLLPTLDWAGGALGVRLRFEPKSIEEFQEQYLVERTTVKTTRDAASSSGREYNLRLWPENMRSFLDQRLRTHFALRAYLLDAAACVAPRNGMAYPQPLPKGSGPIEGNPLDELIQVNEISAQRSFGEPGAAIDSLDGETVSVERKPLSAQLRTYYKKHLDPSDSPELSDLEALEAIEQSQRVFDSRLESGFSAAIKELEELNYPGVADPKLRIATRLRPVDGLNHSATVQYELASTGVGTSTAPLRLPEEYNGLGYQNLISIVFRLMAFRDGWMRVGKAGRASALRTPKRSFLPPLHLVLIEEPEAHLHPQVQQVFVRKAYDILRNHSDLKSSNSMQTQLVVSTHSSHVAHECPFSCLRYFRRLASIDGGVPTTAVINLTEVFGRDDETQKFVTRYIRAIHCDLFFADGAILVEGDAERILLPHFIREHFSRLNRCYVTLMQVGGRHAHRLRNLIEHLGLTTLIVTDIDTGEAAGRHKSTHPRRACGQVTTNPTLKTWHPAKVSYDDLLDLPEDRKVKLYDFPHFSVRVAYQGPVTIRLEDKGMVAEALPSTFEDAVALENLELFKDIDGGDLVTAIKELLNSQPEVTKIGGQIFKAVRETKGKAEFALDLLMINADLAEVKIPKYIDDGLKWLELQLHENSQLVLQSTRQSETAAASSSTSNESSLNEFICTQQDSQFE